MLGTVLEQLAHSRTCETYTDKLGAQWFDMDCPNCKTNQQFRALVWPSDPDVDVLWSHLDTAFNGLASQTLRDGTPSRRADLLDKLEEEERQETSA